jgi:hypothetical protein
VCVLLCVQHVCACVCATHTARNPHCTRHTAPLPQLRRTTLRYAAQQTHTSTPFPLTSLPHLCQHTRITPHVIAPPPAHTLTPPPTPPHTPNQHTQYTQPHTSPPAPAPLPSPRTLT